MFDTFDLWVQLNDPHLKKDERNEGVKSTCMLRFELILKVKILHGLGPSAQDT